MLPNIKLRIKSYLYSFAKKILGRYLSGYIVHSKNGILVCPIDDVFVSRILASRGKYDWDVVEHLYNYINPSSRVLIVGAHIGSAFNPYCKTC